MKLIVTGSEGQVARSLLERGLARGVEVRSIARPQLDLADADTIARTFEHEQADVVVNAAAYTQVDRAESEEALATRVNGVGAGLVAAAARRIGAPVIQVSTDYVFDGSLDRPYREEDATGPVGAYGRSKLAGERAVAIAHPDHVILRTAWVYSPFGANFVRTMLRLGETRSEISVVADQAGCPTSALDIADAILMVARRWSNGPRPANLSGVFHLTGAGEATWAEFATAIFAEAEKHGRAPVTVKAITTAQYPTPARRPANSRLDGTRLREVYGVAPPHWRDSLRVCVSRLLTAPDK